MNRHFKRNKLFTVALASTTVIGATSIVTSVQAEELQFSDITPDQYYYEAVLDLANQQIMNGYTDGTFKADQPITRAEAAIILWKVLNVDFLTIEDPGFKDIPNSHPYYKEIATLTQLDVIHGYEDGTFKPTNEMTRGELVKVIATALKLEAKNGEALPFNDVPADHFLAPSIKAVYDHDITKGTSETTFSFNKKVTRGETATFIDRALTVTSQQFDLTVMHSNDTHGRVEMAPKRATAVKEVRSLKPNALLVDAGDVFSGTLYFNEFLGQADVEFMNVMGYDAMTFGNHEFDLGSSAEGHKALVDFINDASFPLVSSNIDFSKDEQFTGLFSDLISSEPENGKIYNGIVKEIDGEKVGIFGLTTAETKDIASPGKVQFEDYIEEAKKAVKAFEDQGVNKIIVLSHLGYDDRADIDNDLELAKAVDGIDIIVGGHSHTKLDEPVAITSNTVGVAKDTTLIVQAYQYSDYLGTLDVTFDENGVIVNYDGELLELANYADDEKALQLLQPYKNKVDSVQNEEIGATATSTLANPRVSDEGNEERISVRKNETALGNIITDGMLEKAKQYTDKEVIMAIQNGGGIRAAIDKGPITVGEVIAVLPFGNTLALMDVTGEELRAAFEVSVGKYPDENGGFLHVSKGTKIEFDSSKPAGERVVSITYTDASGNEKTLQDNQTYTIATNAFTAKGGDGYEMFAIAYGEGRVTDLGLSDWENLSEKLKAIGEVMPTIGGRIQNNANE